MNRLNDGYVGCPDIDDPNAFAARVHGDTMLPDYAPNDIVIFSPAQAPCDGDDCFVRYRDGRTTFKQVFREGDELRLMPRNTRYKPEQVLAVEVEVTPAVFKYVQIARGGG